MTLERSKTSVVLVNPSISWRYGIGRLFYTTAPPLGLGYLASVLRADGHRVAIVDLQVSSLRDLFATIREVQPEIVGISCQTETRARVKMLTLRIQRKFGVPVVVGGPHASLESEATLSGGGADIVVRQEGEKPILEIARRVAAGTRDFTDIPGVSCRVGSRIHRSPDREPLQDLDLLPFPALDLLPLHRYRTGPNRRIRTRFMPMIAGRGCPYRCKYCASAAVHGRTSRTRSTDNIQSEIRHWRSQVGEFGLVFWDDTFTLDRGRAFELCDMLTAEDVEWCCTTRPDRFDAELARAMRRAGCTHLYLGAESFSQDTLRVLGRTSTPQQSRAAASSAMSAGIKTCVGIVTAVPGQTLAEIRADIRELFRLGVDFPTINILSQYPGSSFPDSAKACQGRFSGAVCRVQTWVRRNVVRALRILALIRYHVTAAVRRPSSRSS